MRFAQHLQAAVVTSGAVDSDERATQQGKKHTVLIPVAVILMPRPRAPDARLLHNHLRVVMVDLAFQQLLGRVDDGMAAREHPVDSITRMVPQREPYNTAFRVRLTKRVIVESLVLLRGAP